MESHREFGHTSGWAIAIGILMIILGILAIISPLVASFAVNFVLGWIFIAGGIVQAFYAFQHNRGAGTLVLKLLLSLFYLVVGILLLANPWAGVVSLTLIIGLFFVVDGIGRVFLAFQLKPARRWGWVLFNGILMIILGILIWSQWPYYAPWILGLLVGIGLFVNGLATVFFGSTAYTLSQE